MAGKRKGVTLLELLIAFGILALVLIPFLRSFLTTGRAVRKRGDYATAVYLCQKIIEDIRYDLYNDDSTDFSRFLRQSGETDRVVVPGPDCSRFFRGLLSPDGTGDQAIIAQLRKFTVTVDCGDYFVPMTPTPAEQAAGATVDVDGDGVKDPDAALITVIVSWKDNTAADRKDHLRELRFSTIVATNQDEQREQIGAGF